MCFVKNVALRYVALRYVTSRYVTLRYEKEKVSNETEVDVFNCINCTVDFLPFLEIIKREIMRADVRTRTNLESPLESM